MLLRLVAVEVLLRRAVDVTMLPRMPICLMRLPVAGPSIEFISHR